MKKKYLLLLFTLVLCLRMVHAQERTVFLELGGSGGLGSFNFEKWNAPDPVPRAGIHSRDPKSWWYGMRYGISASPIDKNNGWVIVAPVMASVLYKKYRSPHGFEISGGFAPSFTTKGALFIKSPFALGYRFQRWDKRIFFRVAYTPLFAWLVDFQWQHWAGISVGYQLASKQ